MKRWIKIAAIATAGLAAAAAATLALASVAADSKMQRKVQVDVRPIALLQDAASVQRGRYLFNSRGCTECHGADGAGREFINDGKGMVVHAPNITTGPGGVVAAYRSEDWVRTIRHGVKPDGRPAFIMPSEDYARMTDADLTALVAYVRQMPGVAGQGAGMQVPAVVKALYAFGLVQDAAEKIDHAMPPPAPVPEDVSLAHGAYVANMCIGCHGAHLSGGKIPGAPPEWPAAANLTPGDGSAMKGYANAAQFQQMLRTGKRPDGSAVSGVMPFASLRELNEVDAQALYLYLANVAPRPAGQR